MKVHWLVLMIVVGAALFAPAVSAKIIEERDGFVVSTVEDGDAARQADGGLFMPAMALMASSSLVQGQTVSYSTYVSSGKTRFSGDLNWGNTANTLTLTIDSPAGVFGPYYDSVDGVIDGRIFVRITNYGGLPTGYWYSDVYGQKVSGTQVFSYTGAVS